MGQSPPPRKPGPPPASQKSRASSKRPRKASKRSNGVGRALGVVTLILLATMSIYGGYIYRKSGALHKYVTAFMQAEVKHPFHALQPADVFPDQVMNMLVIGRDADYNDKDQVIKTHARSDLLMVAHIDFPHNNVTLLSIPRDTKANIPRHGVSKINAAHAFGGPELTAETVESNFGISTQKYIALDFEGFEQAIDLLGGVDLVVDRKMDYDDNWGHLHIHLLPGQQHLDGKEAMGFVRFRHADSDLVRIQRQQTLLNAIKEKLHQPAIIAKLPAILDVIDKHVDSDLTTEQKIVLAGFLHDTPRDQIQMATLPSQETSGTYVLTDWSKATPMIQKIFGVAPPENLADDGVTHHRHRHHRRATRVAELP
jgi:polyisoprenyl-teichoic acid--peptidoglycan teichoic acid transferase